MNTKLTKNELRQIARRLIVDNAYRQDNSHIEKVTNSPEFINARVVGLYLSTDKEPATGELIAAAFASGKRVAVSAYNPQTRLYDWVELLPNMSLVEAKYGIMEPVGAEFIDPLEIDACFIPGMLFDKRGVRLGHGAGFYDRLLSQLRVNAVIVGVAFPWQIVDALPVEPHDIFCTKVIY